MSVPIGSIPAAHLYWGHVPPTGPAHDDALRFRFERVLPVPVEHLHIVQAPLPDRGFLLVGIEPERLRAYLASCSDVGTQTWELVPDHLPPHLENIAGADETRKQLNLLQGEFISAVNRRIKRRTSSLIHLAIALMLVCLVVGVERRRVAADHYAQAQRQAVATALASVLPAQTNGQRPEVRLTMEVRRLEQAANDPAAATTDVIQTLQAVWRIWPRDIRAQIDTIGANSERLVIRGRVADLAAAEALATACAQITASDHRFRAEPLQAQRDEQGAGFLLTLVRQDRGGRP